MPSKRDELLAWIERTGACCPNCGYSLRGLAEPRCPECGVIIRYMPPEVAWRRKHNAKLIAGVILSALASAYLGFGGSTSSIAVVSACMGFAGFACAVGALLAWEFPQKRFAGIPRLRMVMGIAWAPCVVNGPILTALFFGAIR